MSVPFNKRSLSTTETDSECGDMLHGFLQDGHTIKDGVKFFYALAESGNLDIIRTNLKIASVVNTSRIGSTATLRIGEEILKKRSGMVATGERVFELLCDNPVTQEEFQSMSALYLETLYTLFSQVKGVTYDMNNPVHAEFLQGADSFARFLLNLPEDTRGSMKEVFPRECSVLTPVPQYTAPALEMQPLITAKLADERLPVDTNSDSFEQSVYLTADICTTSVLHKMFLIAAANGHEQLLTMLHPYISNTEPVTSDGDTALCVAAKARQVNCVRELVRLGFNVNQPGALGCIPLTHAVNLSDIVTVRHLLESRADPNQASVSKNTPLHVAAIRGNADVLRLLLVAGASPTALSSSGLTALEMAANSDCRRILLNNLPDYMTRTATEVANSKIYYNLYPDLVSFNASIDNTVNYVPRPVFDVTFSSIELDGSVEQREKEEVKLTDFLAKHSSSQAAQRQYMASADSSNSVGSNAFGFNDLHCPTPFKQLMNGALPRLLWSAIDTENPFTVTSKTLVEDEVLTAKGSASVARSVITEDSLLTGSFGVFPYDHLTPGERVIALSMVLFSLVPRKTDKSTVFNQATLMYLLTAHEHLPANTPPANIMYESALYVLFRLIFRRIQNEIVRDRSDVINPQDDRVRWRTRCYAAFEHISAGKPSNFGLEVSCDNLNVWNTVLDIIACGLFGSAFWEKRKLFSLPNPLQRYQAYPHLQRLPHGYFSYSPPPVFMSLLIFMKMCAFATHFVADVQQVQNICLCYDCICKQATESRSRELIKGLVAEEDYQQQQRNRRLTSAKVLLDLKKKKKPIATTNPAKTDSIKSNFFGGVLSNHNLHKCLDASAMHGQLGLGLGGILAQYTQVSDGIHSLFVHPDILAHYTYMNSQQKLWIGNLAIMAMHRDQVFQYFDALPFAEKLQLVTFEVNQHPADMYMFPHWELCRFGLECYKKSHHETDALIVISNKIALNESFVVSTDDNRLKVMLDAACAQVSSVNVLLPLSLASYLGMPARPNIDVYLQQLRDNTKNDKLQTYIDSTMVVSTELQGHSAPLSYTYGIVHLDETNNTHVAGNEPCHAMQQLLDYVLAYDHLVSASQWQHSEQVLNSMNLKSEETTVKPRTVEQYLRSEAELVSSLYNDGYVRKFSEYMFFIALLRKMSENYLKFKNEESARLIGNEFLQDLDKKKKKKKEKGVSKAVENSLYANLSRPKDDDEDDEDEEATRKAAVVEKLEKDLEEERQNVQIRTVLEDSKRKKEIPKRKEEPPVAKKEEKREPPWVLPKFSPGDLLPIGLKFPVDFSDPVNEVNVLPDRWWQGFTEGYIFAATTEIIHEMMILGVVGAAVKYLPEMQSMHLNSAIFLYNTSTKCIIGVFQLENKQISTMYPKALQCKNGNYSAQVQVKAFYLFPAITEREFKKFAFMNTPNTAAVGFTFKKITSTETQQVQSTMRAKRLVPTPASIKAEAEKERIEKEQREKQERLKQEKEQRDREKKERIEREKAEKERQKQEREKQERLEREKAEKDKLEKQKLEKLLHQQQQLQQQQQQQQQAEKERLQKTKQQQGDSRSGRQQQQQQQQQQPAAPPMLMPQQQLSSPLSPNSIPGLLPATHPTHMMYGDYNLYGQSGMGFNMYYDSNNMYGYNNNSSMMPNGMNSMGGMPMMPMGGMMPGHSMLGGMGGYNANNMSGMNMMNTGNNMMNTGNNMMMGGNSMMVGNNIMLKPNNNMNMMNNNGLPGYNFWSDPNASATSTTGMNNSIPMNSNSGMNNFWTPSVTNMSNVPNMSNNMMPVSIPMNTQAPSGLANFFANPRVTGSNNTLFENIWPTNESSNVNATSNSNASVSGNNNNIQSPNAWNLPQ